MFYLDRRLHWSTRRCRVGSCEWSRLPHSCWRTTRRHTGQSYLAIDFSCVYTTFLVCYYMVDIHSVSLSINALYILGISKFLWCKDVPILQFLIFTTILIPCFIINGILTFFNMFSFNAFSFAGCLILWKRKDLLTGCERHVIGQYHVTGTGGHPFPSGSARMVKRWEKWGIIGGSTK